MSRKKSVVRRRQFLKSALSAGAALPSTTHEMCVACVYDAENDCETMKTKAWQARRWFLLAGGVFGSLIAAVLGVYGWAW